MECAQAARTRAGGTQDSTRVWRALIYGCIPVTYFRAVELPFMRRLGIDYGQFSVNIQPDDFDTTQAGLPPAPAQAAAWLLSQLWDLTDGLRAMLCGRHWHARSG